MSPSPSNLAETTLVQEIAVVAEPSYPFTSAWYITAQSDGKYVVVGEAYDTDWLTSVCYVWRYNTDGTLDTSFGTNGKFTLDKEGDYCTPSGVAIRPNGKILVSLWTDISPYCFQLNTDGSLDTSFGTNGFAVLPIAEGSISFVEPAYICSDGKILIAGSDSLGGGWANVIGHIWKLNEDGSLDTTFATNGIYSYPAYFITSLAVQADNKIVWCGHNDSGTAWTIGRLNADGSLDGTFGTGGLFVPPGLTVRNKLYDIFLQSDGKIVCIGGYYTRVTNPYAGGILAFRCNTDGTIDTSFGVDGYYKHQDHHHAITVGYESYVLPSEKIVIVGGTYLSNHHGDDAYSVRITRDGALDTSYDIGGRWLYSKKPDFSYFNSVVAPTEDTMAMVGTYWDDTGTLSEALIVFVRFFASPSASASPSESPSLSPSTSSSASYSPSSSYSPSASLSPSVPADDDFIVSIWVDTQEYRPLLLDSTPYYEVQANSTEYMTVTLEAK